MRKDRASWPVRKVALEDDDDDISHSTTLFERLAMMWPLTREAWLLAGQEIPSYERRDIPGTLYRPGELRPDAE